MTSDMDHNLTQLFLRVNGSANAWPVFIGGNSPYYATGHDHEYSNASYSVVASTAATLKPGNTKWEIMIDGGHGLVQYMLNNFNRLPEVLILTHPHSDHIIAAEYFIQSYYRSHNKEKKMPVYASAECWLAFTLAFAHITKMCDYRELVYGATTEIPEADNTKITAFPVFHGQSARGASMLLLEQAEKKIIFTGDVLFPLVRTKDLDRLQSADFIVPDCNNRFPYPKSNHWSITNNPAQFLQDFAEKDLTSFLVAPHISSETSILNHRFLSEFISDHQHNQGQILDNLMDFCKLIRPKRVAISHYGGNEDERHHSQQKLNRIDLRAWTEELFISNKIEAEVKSFSAGDVYRL